MKKKLLIGLLVTILLVIIIAITLILVTNTQKNESNINVNNDNSSNLTNKINNNVANKKELIKVESAPDGYSTYLLDTEGKIYVAGFAISDKFIEVKLDTTDKVVDIVNTEVGLIFKLQNGEYYLISNDIKSDKTIKTSLKIGTAKRIMLDNIKSVTDMTSIVSSIQFLTDNGDVYELVNNANSGEDSNVKKIFQNIKSIKSYGDNIAILDNNGTGYVYGYNVNENGILGTSDSDSDKEYISTPQKIGDNLKDINIVQRNLMKRLIICAINTNNELLVMGETKGTSLLMGNKKINTLTKIYDNVKEVEVMIDGTAIVTTLDNDLIHLDFRMNELKETKILNNVKKVCVPDYGGILILDQSNTLYGYGENSTGKFGTGESGNILNKAVVLKNDVKNIFSGKTYGGNASFVITQDGRLYGAGSNERGALGIPDQKSVKEFKQIDY